MLSQKSVKNQHMNQTTDPLIEHPSLRYLRDSLIIRDPEARKAGEGLVTRILLLATMDMRLPADRLVTTQDAARLIGVDEETLDRLCYTAQIKPKYSLARNTYWLAKDIYRLID